MACHYCATALPDDRGLDELRDDAGFLCCDECYHAECGFGHGAAEDREDCYLLLAIRQLDRGR